MPEREVWRREISIKTPGKNRVPRRLKQGRRILTYGISVIATRDPVVESALTKASKVLSTYLLIIYMHMTYWIGGRPRRYSQVSVCVGHCTGSVDTLDAWLPWTSEVHIVIVSLSRAASVSRHWPCLSQPSQVGRLLLLYVELTASVW